MIIRSDLTDRASIVMDSFAFEIGENEEFGKKIIMVTDCLEESNKAVFFVIGDELIEKVSGFSDDFRYKELKDVVKVNTELILEEFYER